VTDGRVYTLEDELDVTHEELGRARRRYDDMLRARSESRVTNEPEFDRAVWRQGERVRVLERELARLQAEALSAGEAA
jgi:hypothetical protein